MNKKILLLYMAILFAIPVMSQTVELVDVPDAKPGTVTVVMNMSGFATDAGSLSIYLEYDNDLLTYLGSSEPLVGGLWVTPDSGGKLTVGWFDVDGKDINGDFVVLHFDYAGGIETSITFSETIESEITDVPGNNFNPTYIPATISPAIPVGIASLNQEIAVAGNDVDIILKIEDDGGFNGEVYAITLKIGYDTGKLTFNGLGDNPLNLLDSEQDGVITLQYINLTPLNAFPYEVELNFTYDGVGYAPVWFASGSVISGEKGETLFTEFDDEGAGVYQSIQTGKITIQKVVSQGAEEDPMTPGNIDPDNLDVKISAEGLAAEELGLFTLNIAYDTDKLEYKGPFNLSGGYSITHAPGTLSITRIVPDGFTIDGDFFTMNFDYFHVPEPGDIGQADIVFQTGTLLQRKEPDLSYIDTELVNGFVTTGYELDVKVFLQGPYRDVLGEMDDLFQTLGYIPEDQPYNTSPWNYSGDESATVPAGVVDWIFIQIREAALPGGAVPATVKWEGAVFLNTQGQVVSLDGTTLPVAAFVPDNVNDLFVVVNHRTHLAIMSATHMNFSGGTLAYDFSNSSVAAYDANTGLPTQKELAAGLYGMFVGDVDQSTEIDFNDMSIIFSLFGDSGYSVGDVNMDNQIDFDDVSDSFSNQGFNSYIPE